MLTDWATQCLTDFSLDFERTSVDPVDGPDMTVRSVFVDGRPATFKFVQPTYPGDPNGQNDPNPLAHQASQVNPVGGPHNNPLPPACTPEVTGGVNAQNGDPCPANKLVITPAHRIPANAPFVVTVYYTGRPGVHTDGDGTTEGWFRNDSPPGDGGFVTTEPVGTEDWMPLNDHPSAKPTYDFFDTVNAGKTAVANGVLLWSVHNKPDANFPGGSTTWRWHSPAPIASYLVENSVGDYDLTTRKGPTASATTRRRAVRSTPRRSRPTSRSWTSSRTSPISRASSTAASRSRRTASLSVFPRRDSKKRCRR